MEIANFFVDDYEYARFGCGFRSTTFRFAYSLGSCKGRSYKLETDSKNAKYMVFEKRNISALGRDLARIRIPANFV